MENNGMTVEKRESEIELTLRDQEKVIVQLECLVNNISDMMQAVMRSPLEKRETEEKILNSACTPLGIEIESANERLKNVCAQLEEMRDLCEL